MVHPLPRPTRAGYTLLLCAVACASVNIKAFLAGHWGVVQMVLKASRVHPTGGATTTVLLRAGRCPFNGMRDGPEKGMSTCCWPGVMSQAEAHCPAVEARPLASLIHEALPKGELYI